MEIEDHYSQLLSIRVPWEIGKVDLDLSAHRVDIEIEYTGVTGACPECGANCPGHDDRKPRSWRHLDTMQFATYLHCSVPVDALGFLVILDLPQNARSFHIALS